VQQDRYCRSCGQELRPEDQFCANCGRPVHATAHVPAPEADVPVPPPPEQAEASQQSPQAVEQTAAPSPEPQERLQWRWKWARGSILLFLVSTFIASVQANIGATIGRWIVLLVSFGLLWLILGGLVFLVARLIGRKPSFFWVLFDWWVTLAVVAPILLGGPLGGLLRIIF
jgi:zinc-ribbon domain